jgi:hypothetical protein
MLWVKVVADLLPEGVYLVRIVAIAQAIEQVNVVPHAVAKLWRALALSGGAVGEGLFDRAKGL